MPVPVVQVVGWSAQRLSRAGVLAVSIVLGSCSSSGGEPSEGYDEVPYGDYDHDDSYGDDCNDWNPNIHPGARDRVGDGVDANCDGRDGVDADSDGYASVESGGSDCNDGDPEVNVGALDGADWTIEEIAPEGTEEIAATLDADGHRHAAWVRVLADSRELRYATDASGAWVVETVPSVPADRVRIAAAADGAHLEFESEGREVWHATNASGEWTSDLVASSSAVLDAGIAAGPDGVVHVVYVSEEWLYHESGPPWQIEGIAPADRGGPVVAASDGTLHVVYGDNDSRFAASNVTGAWSSSDLGLASPDGDSIAARDEGSCFVARFTSEEYDPGELRVGDCYGDSYDWLPDTERAESSSVGVDQFFRPHVAYVDSYALTVLYTRREEPGRWARPLKVASLARASSSLMLDEEGRPTIAFANGRSIQWARPAPSDGVDDDCDGVP